VTRRWQADLALAFVALIWGTTFVVVKRALGEISTLYFLALRFTLAAICMLLLFLPSFRRAGWRTVLRGLRGGAAAGVFLWLGYVLQTTGLKYTSAGNSGFLTGLYVVLAPLVSATYYRRWPQRIELVGIAIAGAGMLLMTIPEPGDLSAINVGDLLTIACAIAYAIHLVVLGHFSQTEQFEAVAIGQIALTAILSFTAFPFDPPRALWSRGVVLAIILTGVFATAIAFSLQTWGQQFTTATRTALIFALEPVFALATAVLFGGETLRSMALIGAALILGGILTVELKPVRVL